MSKTTILIVEDEAVVAEDLSQKLRRLGYEVSGVTGRGEEAVALAREGRPDLVLMDVHLLGPMDGVEAAARIRRECALPVIFVTAHSDRATLERAKLSEPFGYILKPFEHRDLETHIEMSLYRHRTEAALRESEERFRLFMDHSPIIAWMKDEQGRHVYLNRAFQDRFGMSLAEARGKTDAELWPPEMAEVFRRNDQAVLAAGRPVELTEETLNPDGSRCHWLSSKFLFRAAAGQRFVAGVRMDITELKRTEQALRAANGELTLFNQSMVGRELRMIELKKEIDELCVRLGEPPRYGNTPGQ